MYIGGDAASANSGLGFMMSGDPATCLLAWQDFELSNLNVLFGKMGTVSARVSYISYNF
jgi:hypothetical protein